MFLADLKIFQSESDQFGASQAASHEHREDRPITFASQAISRFCEQGSGLFDGQPVSNPNALEKHCRRDVEAVTKLFHLLSVQLSLFLQNQGHNTFAAQVARKVLLSESVGIH